MLPDKVSNFENGNTRNSFISFFDIGHSSSDIPLVNTSSNDKNWWLFYEESISSSIADACRLAEEIADKLRKNSWNNEISDQVFIAIEEALTNAVCHGNHSLSWKKVNVRCGISRDLVRIEISDEGEGFNPDLVPDSTDLDHLRTPNGRGIHLMRYLMDKVEFSSGGTRVYMEKKSFGSRNNYL